MEESGSGVAAGPSKAVTLGQRVQRARRDAGLTRAQAGGSEFTAAYIDGLEGGRVRPSQPALELLAGRLGVPLAELQQIEKLQASLSGDPDLGALEEDLLYQANYAKMLLRIKRIDRALELLSRAEESAAPYSDRLSVRVRYMLPFLRGRAYIERLQPNLAERELEAALAVLRDAAGRGIDLVEDEIRVRNLMGVMFYEKEEPDAALRQHLECAYSLQGLSHVEFNLRASIYRNLANDYWALGDFRGAIGIYKEALRVLEDLDDLDRQAALYLGLAIAYREVGEAPHAILYATRALQLFEALGNSSEATSACMHLAETLIEEGRLEEAEGALERAEGFAAGTGNPGLLSALCRDRAELALRSGNLEAASRYARESIDYAEVLRDAVARHEAPASDGFWADPVRTYSHALHIKALVEEASGQRAAADRLFASALEQIGKTGVGEAAMYLTFSYAQALGARQYYEAAVKYYQAAVELRERAGRSSVSRRRE